MKFNHPIFCIPSLIKIRRKVRKATELSEQRVLRPYSPLPGHIQHRWEQRHDFSPIDPASLSPTVSVHDLRAYPKILCADANEAWSVAQWVPESMLVIDRTQFAGRAA